MAFVTASDGTGIYVEDTAASGAPAESVPVVFIHGWPLSGAMWEYQITDLVSAGIRCVTYDRRGFGRSDKPGGGYDYDTMADDLAVVIDSLNVAKVVIVGFSMGGGEVVRYLGRHGSAKVSKAVLLGAVPPFLLKTSDNPGGADKSTFDGMIAGLSRDRPKFLANFNKTFFGAGLLNFSVSQEIMDWAGMIALQASPVATLGCVRAFSETDFRPDCPKVDVPMLIIHGSSDEIVPPTISSELTAKLIPQSELKLYDGAPHAFPMTHAEKLNADLKDFLGT